MSFNLRVVHEIICVLVHALHLIQWCLKWARLNERQFLNLVFKEQNTLLRALWACTRVT